MKKLYLVFSTLAFLVFGMLELHAQCPTGSTTVTCGDPVQTFTTNPPATCDGGASDCTGLSSEILAITYPDTIILGAEQMNMFDPCNYLEGLLILLLFAMIWERCKLLFRQ